MIDIEGSHRNLIESLRLVAADFETQVGSMPEFVGENVPDEIALTFDDVFIIANHLRDAELISDAAMENLTVLNDHFTRMTEAAKAGDHQVWTLDGLRWRPEWTRARQLATEILGQLDTNAIPPDSLRQ